MEHFRVNRLNSAGTTFKILGFDLAIVYNRDPYYLSTNQNILNQEIGVLMLLNSLNLTNLDLATEILSSVSWIIP